MIIPFLKLNDSLLDRIKKIDEELKEFSYEAIEYYKNDYNTIKIKMIMELFDVIHASQQTILKIIKETSKYDLAEEYTRYNKLHLEKICDRINDNEVQIEEFVEIK
jgi:hypothetical protein